MRRVATLIAIAAICCTSASAQDFRLKPGEWHFHEGLDVGAADQSGSPASQSRRTLCIDASRTDASADWFVDLAKPRPDCTSMIRSQTAHEIRTDMRCPMSNGALKGPSIIRIYENRITIDNQLQYDLPHQPLYMGQQKSVLHVSGQCSVSGQ